MPFDTSQYDDRVEVADYLWHNYPILFSQEEQLAARTLSAEWKAAHANSEQMRRVLLERLSARGNPKVDELLADGPQEFRLRAAERLLAQQSSAIDLNRCQMCFRIVATPMARQCLWCGHVWH